MRHIPTGIRAAVVLVLAAATTLLVASPAAAADPATDFTYTVSGSSATITGYIAGNTVADIPATITDGSGTYTVTAIGDSAFYNSVLTSVTIPDTVTEIGVNAFAGARFPSVTIPDSVITIDSGAFDGAALTSVTIGDSVTTIGAYAFATNALTSVVIPDSVTSIGEAAFLTNPLTSVTIGDSVTTIGYSAFQADALTSVTIPGSVTAIGAYAFVDNPLTSVFFAGDAPTTVTGAGASGSLGTGAGLTVYYYSGASGFTSPWNSYPTVRAISAAESDLTATPAGPVATGTPYTLTATVRDSTQAPVVGAPVAFTVPAGVTASATECTTTAGGTCAITLTSTVATTYTITATVGADPIVLSQDIVFDAVAPGGFTYTVSGGSATIIDYVGGGTVADIPATITDGSGTYSVTAIGDNAFRGYLLTSVTIPDTVTSIGDNAFRGDALTSVTIPDSVTSIGTYAFYNNALTSVVIPDSITTISNNAFRGNALTSVTIPDTVTSIGNNSFASNDLTSVTIPDSVTSLGAGTFAANLLTSVIFAGNAPTITAAGVTGSLDIGTGLIVYYYSGASGFAPSWNGYTTRAISAADSDLVVTPVGPVIAGTTPYTLTVTVHDDTSAPVAGVPVAFAIPAGVTASAAGCTTATDGTCAITLTSTTAATYVVTATVGSDPTVLSQDVTFAAAAATTIPADDNVDPALAFTGLDAAAPLTLGGGLFALGLAFLAAALVRRKRALR